MSDRLRWKLWWWITKLPNVCPANAHTVLIFRDRRDLRVDDMCRRDATECGVCWCGKIDAAQVRERTTP